MQFITLPYSENPWLYLSKIADWPGLIWYHNGKEDRHQEWISALPSRNFEYLGAGKTKISHYQAHTEFRDGDFFDLLKAETPCPDSDDKEPFGGGLAGHLAYDLGLEMHNIRSTRSAESLAPLAVVGLYEWSLQINHSKGSAQLCIQDSCPGSIRSALSELADNLRNTSETNMISSAPAVTEWHCAMDKPYYENAFHQLKDYIVAGDVYQVNLTRQWVSESADLKQESDLALYYRLSHAMPAPFSVFHRTDSHSLLSVSPERFVQVRDGRIMTQPIKGTRPRGKTPAEDKLQSKELLNSEKDRAENLMIVDLLRNDIAKNAQPGSVQVDKLFEVQSFRNVHHLVSTISAVQKTTSHSLDILRDAFPGGSITGAPKKRAMEVIEELETTNRGNYCGCSFYINSRGDLDSNILIRTITLTDGRLTCSGGGGIVHDSEVQAEYDESAVKVQRLLSSLTEK